MPFSQPSDLMYGPTGNPLTRRPFSFPVLGTRHFGLHRAGFEPATLRLKAGGSAVELSVPAHGTPYATAPGRNRTSNRLFRREPLWSVELPTRQVPPHRFLLSNMTGFLSTQHSALSTPPMHPAGVEPATLRLRAESSARLSYECGNQTIYNQTLTSAPGRDRTSNLRLRGPAL